MKKIRSDKGKLRIPLHQCNVCEYKNRSNVSVETHYLTNHASEEERKEKYKYYCDKCLYGSMSVTGWRKHQETRMHKRILELSRSLSSHG